MVSTCTKIICTIGPASNTVATLMALTEAGMNVCRLNFSHGTHEEHAELIKRIREVKKKTGHPLAILQDLQGPKIRVGELPKDGVEPRWVHRSCLLGHCIIQKNFHNL